MRLAKFQLLWAVLLISSFAFASNGTIRLTTFPSMTVADARSTVVVTAEVRDQSGRLVADGTQIVFEASQGSFREQVVTTVGGVARGTFVPAGVPGTAKITASAYLLNATTTVELDMVADRSMLSSANEYVEVVAPQYLMYSVDQRVVGAAGPNKGVHLRYRDIEVDADDLQFNASTYELRARRAQLKMGKFEAEFGELYLIVNTHRGFGTTKLDVPELALTPFGTMFRLVESGNIRERYGLAQISLNGLKPYYEVLPADQFAFADLTESMSKINSKKAVIFPNKEIQFQRAEIYMGDAKVLRMPLFQVNLMGGTPLITDQVLNIENNQLAINYPYYLSLKPGETSLFRFRTGERYGRGTSVNAGAYLDYEMNWNRGDESQGGLTLSGLARNDWGLNLRQFIKVDDRTNAFAQADLRSLRNLYGSGSISRQMDGFQVSLNGNASRTLQGVSQSSELFSLAIEKDPTKVGNLPMRLYYGLMSNYNATSNPSFNSSQSTYGVRARAVLLPITLDKNASLNGGFSVGQFSGRNAQKGLTMQGTMNLSYRVSRDASILGTYDFVDDAFSQAMTGKHRISLSGNYFSGKASVNFFASRSLDADRMNYFGDALYKFSPLWKVALSYTHDQFLSSKYTDFSFTLIHTFGFRDFGLTYSGRTKRFGIQVLGTSF